MDIYGILAHPAGHSKSPLMQQAAFDALGIAARYERFDIPPAALADFVQRVREQKIAGLSVSIPHKESIVPFLDAVDPVARAIGAVNTVLWRAGQLVGTNTDWQGAMDALVEHVEIRDARVAVLGAGGAARAVVYGLVQRGAGEIAVFSRRGVSLADVAPAAPIVAGELDDISSYEADILINTTPLGMAGALLGQSPVSPGYFRFRQPLVYDLIYNPRETLLLADARAAGCATLNGLAMFVYQGAAQFHLWTGRAPPIAVMKQSLAADV